MSGSLEPCWLACYFITQNKNRKKERFEICFSVNLGDHMRFLILVLTFVSSKQVLLLELTFLWENRFEDGP